MPQDQEPKNTQDSATEQLLKIARDKSYEGRQELARAISDLFTRDEDVLSDRERVLMFDILRKLVHDFEVGVRKIISEQLAAWPDMPPDMANFLANDEIEIAYPILTSSTVLQNENLIEIVRHRTMEHRLAISIREHLSETVSDALVQAGESEVILKLLANKSANISDTTMSYLIEESKRVDSFREPILRREDLDPALAQKMYTWVSAALRKYIVSKFGMDEDAVDDVLESAAIKMFAETTYSGPRQRMADKLVSELEKIENITPEALIDVLRGGEVNLFISLFMRLSGLREKLTKRILFEPGGEGLAIACCALGMDKAQFSTIFTLSRSAQTSRSADFSKDIRSVLKFFGTLDKETTEKVLHRWQRDSGYLAAIRELEIGG